MTSNPDLERAETTAQRSQIDHPDDPINPPDRNLVSMDEFSDDSSPPTPRFIQDQGQYRYLRWVPTPIRRICKRFTKWTKGPNPPQPYRIKPILSPIQQLPIQLLDRYVPKKRHRLGLLAGYYFLWILTFALVMRQSTVATEIEGYGAPLSLSCGAAYWSPGNQCGLNGNDCRPFNGSSLAFRCPANCKSRWILNPRAVGAQEVNYRPFVIGGPSQDDHAPVYRGDSFICGSAIHAGVINNGKGGCGVVSLVGSRQKYTKSNRHGISSIEFNSEFPSSFTFESGISCTASDPRWLLLCVSVIFTVIFSLFTTSPAIFFFSVFTGIFAHVGLASDPPWHTSIPGLISNILGKYLPAMFCAFVIYRYMAVRRTLSGLSAPVEKTILWLGGCWVGALSNYTFDWIPIQRLNGHDLAQQPGAITALVIIIIVLVAISISQVFFFQREARLRRMLSLYGIFIAAILLALALGPTGLKLRIHHYILALLLLPGTSMQMRPSLLYQGILVGLFINGIARWGFDSVLQTPDELQGDAQHNSALPVIGAPSINWGHNESTILFSWLPPPDPFDGISVLVNDVERFRGYTDEGLTSDKNFLWTKKTDSGLPDYFRFAYMQGSQAWDYTKAGTWGPDGNWTQMEAGASRIQTMEDDPDLHRIR